MKHMIQKYIQDDNYQLLQEYILLPTDQNFGRIFRYFSETSGLFRFVSKQFCLFRLFRYRFETPKQTEKKFFWFHETNGNKRETDLVSVCFGSNRKLFFFHFEDTLHRTHSPGVEGDGGSIFWKTREIGLPSYNDLSTVLYECFFLVQGGGKGVQRRRVPLQ
jgi:hypothetical protein